MAKKVTLVVFSGELDRALAAFIIATGAAASGMEVTMFFTFWGLNIIKKDKVKSKGFFKKLMNLLNRGGAKRLALSKLHMLGLGTVMLKKFMKDSKMPSLPEMIKMAKGLGVKMIACTTSIGVMGLENDSFIPEVDTLAGVSSYLGDASEAQVNLFI
ncbi:MAG: DsrE/DsrF/DrsH-like family protein [Candidatus Margulisbacteria bacterium]|nr:DsrE/DsrF/DrsH-like family protein [Candidatus Margulisiibacteriota bacterium]